MLFPLLAGLLVGYILKTTVKAIFAVILLVGLLFVMGSLGSIVSGFGSILDIIKSILGVKSILQALPITTPSFFVGVIVGYLLAR